MKIRARRAILAIGALAVASCGGEPVSRAPDFEIVLYQGGKGLGRDTLPLSAVLAKADRPVILNFWAAQCPPCRAELRDFQRVWKELGNRLLVIGVDMGAFTNLGTEEEARRLIGETGVTYPVGAARSTSVVHDYKLLGLPATYFLEPGGEIQRVWTGALDHAKLTELAGDLLAAAEKR